MQLAKELKTMPKLKCHYIKGHQDAKKKKKYLTLPKRYNIEAEAKAEATIMRFQMRQPANKVIPFPASTVHTYIHHQFISSSLNTRLHEELTCTGYWDYLESKYKQLIHCHSETHRLGFIPQTPEQTTQQTAPAGTISSPSV